MNSNNLRINLNGKEINLIGTAHVSQESIEEVKSVIGEEKPGMICVELDQGRYNSITQKENWENLNITKVFKEGKGFLLIANLALTSFQRRLGKELGVKPGDEMKAAVEIAAEMGIPYSLCDREVQITLRRAWAHCGLWSKCKLLASLLTSAFTTEKLTAEEIEKLKDRNELDGMMAELADYLPGVKETLIDERDRYLAAKIWSSVPEDVSADANEAEPVRRIVAVVGAGHMQGIKAHLEKLAAGEETPDVSELDRIPAPGVLTKIIAGFVFPLLLIALVVVGFFRAGAGMRFTMLLHWVLWKGSLAALGAIAALAHPLVILVSFITSPITSFIPTPIISVGIISGLLQGALYKPRVLDAQTIADDITSIKGIYRNRISKALMVFFLSGLGSSIANLISIPVIAGMLAK